MSVRTAPVALALIVAAGSAAHAGTHTWFNDSGGSFQTNANWHPNTGFPGASDTALFGNPAAVTRSRSPGAWPTASLNSSGVRPRFRSL